MINAFWFMTLDTAPVWDRTVISVFLESDISYNYIVITIVSVCIEQNFPDLLFLNANCVLYYITFDEL